MPKGKKRGKRIIGRLEKVDLPDLQLFQIDAKIDTGAFTSSLHVHDIEESIKNEVPTVIFQLVHPTHPSYNNKKFELPIVARKSIRSSSGEEQLRFFINMPVRLFGKIFLTEFNLSDRSNMVYPVLLGRKLLSNDFLVDVTRSNLSLKKKLKRQALKKKKK